MASWNHRAYEVLERAYSAVEAAGLPLAVTAWLTVFAGALAVGLVLRRSGAMGSHWGPAAVVGAAEGARPATTSRVGTSAVAVATSRALPASWPLRSRM